MKKNRFALICMGMVMLYGCTSVQVTNYRVKELRSSPDNGFLLISVGRKDLPGGVFSRQLPFVNYSIFKMEDDTLVHKGILVSEVIDVANLRGHLGDGKYGVIHLKELPKGEYLLSAYKRGNSGTVYSTGTYTGYIPGTRDEVLGAVFYLNLLPGKINYAGELLMVEISTDFIEITNQSKRDLNFVKNLVPEINENDLAINFAKRFHKTGYELQRVYRFK